MRKYYHWMGSALRFLNRLLIPTVWKDLIDWVRTQSIAQIKHICIRIRKNYHSNGVQRFRFLNRLLIPTVWKDLIDRFWDSIDCEMHPNEGNLSFELVKRDGFLNRCFRVRCGNTPGYPSEWNFRSSEWWSQEMIRVWDSWMTSRMTWQIFLVGKRLSLLPLGQVKISTF